MMTQASSLLAILRDRKLLDEQKLSYVESRTGQEGMSAQEIIRAEKLLPSEELAKIQAEVEGFPYINLETEKLNKEAMKDISAKAAATYRFIAFDVKDGNLSIAMQTPQDFQAMEAVKFVAKRKGLKA
ncbi:MAG: hypothetical protein ABIP54_04340, partial [Candidatus Andersenbacteria bacterium]